MTTTAEISAFPHVHMSVADFERARAEFWIEVAIDGGVITWLNRRGARRRAIPDFEP